MPYQEEREAVLRGVKWALNAADAVQRAGGAMIVLDNLSDDMIFTMVNNGLVIKFERRDYG